MGHHFTRKLSRTNTLLVGDKEVDRIEPLSEWNVCSLKHSTYMHTTLTSAMTAFVLTFELTKRGQFSMLFIHRSAMRTHGSISTQQSFQILPALRLGVERIYHFYY